jgi:hypothetical protein
MVSEQRCYLIKPSVPYPHYSCVLLLQLFQLVAFYNACNAYVCIIGMHFIHVAIRTVLFDFYRKTWLIRIELEKSNVDQTNLYVTSVKRRHRAINYDNYKRAE